MVKTVNLEADVPPSREVRITLPDDVPVGPAQITVVVATRDDGHENTLGDLAASEFFGMWRDREDIKDSAAFAQRLRTQAWTR